MRARLWLALKRVGAIGLLALFAWSVACAPAPEPVDQGVWDKLPTYQEFQSRLQEAMNVLRPNVGKEGEFWEFMSQGIVPPVKEALETHFKLATELWDQFKDGTISWNTLKRLLPKFRHSIETLAAACENYERSAESIRDEGPLGPHTKPPKETGVKMANLVSDIRISDLASHLTYYWDLDCYPAELLIANWPFINLRNLILGLVTKMSKMRALLCSIPYKDHSDFHAIRVKAKTIFDDVRCNYDKYRLAQEQCLTFMRNGGQCILLAFELGPLEQDLLSMATSISLASTHILALESLRVRVRDHLSIGDNMYLFMGQVYQDLGFYSAQFIELALPQQCVITTDQDLQEANVAAMEIVETPTLKHAACRGDESQASNMDGADSKAPLYFEDVQAVSATLEPTLAQLQKLLIDYYSMIEKAAQNYVFTLKEDRNGRQWQRIAPSIVLQLTHLLHSCYVLESKIQSICPEGDGCCMTNTSPSRESVRAALEQAHKEAMDYVAQYEGQEELTASQRAALVKASCGLCNFIRVARRWLEAHSAGPALDRLREEFPDVDYGARLLLSDEWKKAKRANHC